MTNSTKTKIVNFALAGSILLGSAMPAFAQSPTGTVYNRGCRTVTDRLNMMVNKIQVIGPRVDAVNDRIVNLVTKKMSKLQQTNPTAYQTLQGYFSTLSDQYGSKVKTDSSTLLTDLQSADNMANSGQCNNSNGAFKTAVSKIKTDRQTLQTDVQAWKGYWTGTIKPYIQSLKTSVTTPAPTQ